MKALVVDDSRAIRILLAGYLKDLGFSVEDAEDGFDALDQLEAHGLFDLVLVDWWMPNMTGIELVKAVREKAEYDKMPLMMVTTESHVESMSDALMAGANEYMMKPFDSEALAEKLQLMGFETSKTN